MKRFYLYLVVILILAFGLRFYKLGVVPHGVTWDEAAIAYNGYSVITTRRDEWLARLPVSFQSFGDYKAPLAIYITGIFVKFLGSSAFVIRIPCAISGVLAVLGIGLLTKELTADKKTALIAALLLAVSPWHLHLTRYGYEAGMALTILLFASWLFFKFFKAKKYQIVYLFFSGLAFVTSLYAYHSAKIVAPLLGLVLFLLFSKQIFKNFKKVLIVAPVLLLEVYPLLKDSLQGKGLERAGTMIFFQDISLGEKLQGLLNATLAHLKLDFWLQGYSTSLRHSNGAWGIVFITTLVLLILAIVLPIIQKKTNKAWIFLVSWLVIGFLPAIVVPNEVPHPNRAFLVLPAILMLAALGVKYLENYLQNFAKKLKVSPAYKDDKMLSKAVLGTLFLVHALLFFSYQKYYYTQFAEKSADDFVDGYMDAFAYTQDFEKGKNGKPKVNNIVFTDEYSQPYIFELLVSRMNPIWYRGGAQSIYLFEAIDQGDLARSNTLVVAGLESGLDENKADYVVYGSDGKPRFKFYYLPEKPSEN